MIRLIKQNKNTGFTLIELLVVIAIIGIMSSVVLASLNSARAKTRDAKRRAELRQVQTALQLYYNDNNGTYPANNNWWGNCSGYGSRATSGANGWVPNLAPTYMAVLPLDPKYNGTGGCYLYNSNGTDFKLLAHQTMETGTCPPIPSTDGMYDPPRSPSQCTISIYTSGAINW